MQSNNRALTDAPPTDPQKRYPATTTRAGRLVPAAMDAAAAVGTGSCRRRHRTGEVLEAPRRSTRYRDQSTSPAALMILARPALQQLLQSIASQPTPPRPTPEQLAGLLSHRSPGLPLRSEV